MNFMRGVFWLLEQHKKTAAAAKRKARVDVTRVWRSQLLKMSDVFAHGAPGFLTIADVSSRQVLNVSAHGFPDFSKLPAVSAHGAPGFER